MLRHLRIIFMAVITLLLVFGSQAAADSPKAAKAPEAICPILVGRPLPAITLEDLDGKTFDLNRAIAKKPTILIYFRGGW